MLVFLIPLMTLAALGFGFSIALHVTILAGYSFFGSNSLYVLLFGLFLVMLAVTVITIQVRHAAGDWMSWRAVFGGCPLWLQALCLISLAYGLFSASAEPALRGASAFVISGYCWAFGILYSAYRQPWLLVGFNCANGHKVSHFNRFCPTCGVSLPRRSGGA